VIAPERQGVVSQVQFDTPILLGIHKHPRQCGAVVPYGDDLAEQLGPQVVVHRPAIIWIDQAEVPDLVALVDVGNAGGGEFQQDLR
jgi:hypothetical protein